MAPLVDAGDGNCAVALFAGPDARPTAYAQTTITVTNLDDSGPGSLQQAIIDTNATSGPDTINFSVSTPGTITLSSNLPDITDNLTISGSGAANLAIDGAGFYRPFTIASGATVIVEAVTVQYGYDADGRRVVQQVNADITQYLWDETSPYGDIVLESDGSGAPIACYTLANTRLLSQNVDGTTSYFLQDAQGGTRALTDTFGSVTDTYAYTAFGDLHVQSGTTPNDYLYTGQRYDTVTLQRKGFYPELRMRGTGMKRYGDLHTKEEFMQLEQIPYSSIRWLWARDFWDLPLNGMVLFEGEKYWAEVFDDSDPDTTDDYRRYVLLILSEEQMAEEEYWHSLFREKVGGRMDFRDDGRLDLGAIQHPKERQEEYIEQYKQRQPPDFSGNACLGWFEI